MKKITRRRFLTKVGGALGGLAASNLIPRAPAFAAESQPIKWGCVDEISGVTGFTGRNMLLGTKAAIKKINETGGILGRKVELIIEDSENNTEVAARKARKLILQDKVDVIQGCASTGTSIAVMKVCTQYKTLQFDTELDAHSDFAAMSEYIFQLAQTTNENERARVIGLLKKYSPADLKRWFLLYPDYVFGHDMRDVLYAELKSRLPDAEWVGSLSHPFGEADFSNHIISILAKKPQVFISLSWCGDANNFITQAIPFGFFDKIPILTFGTGFTESYVTLKEKLPSNIGCLTDQANPFLPHMQAFQDDIYKQMGEWAQNESTPSYYDGPFIYKAAAEKAGTTDAKKMIDALEGMQWKGVSGKRNIRKDHYVDVEFCPMVVNMVPSTKYPWKVPGEVIYIPYEQVKLTEEERVKLGCTFCKGKF